MIKYDRWNIPEYDLLVSRRNTLALSKLENRVQLLRRFQAGEVEITNLIPLPQAPAWARERQYTSMLDIHFYQAVIGEPGMTALLMGRGLRIMLAVAVDNKNRCSLLCAVEEKGDEVIFDTLEKHTAPRGWDGE